MAVCSAAAKLLLPRPTNPAKPGKWLHEAGVYVLLYGVPLLILFPYTRLRPEADFQCSLRTQAVDFTVGAYQKAGPFVGGRADIYFDSFAKAQMPGADLAGGPVRFRNVVFRSLFLPEGTQVKMLWYEQSSNGVEIRLAYSEMPSPPAATVFLDEKSTVESGNGSIQISKDGRGLASIYPNADLHLVVSVTPYAAVAGKPATLPAAEAIPLGPKSGISFMMDDGGSGILGVSNTLQIRNAERKETLLRGQRLEIARLKQRSKADPSQLSLQIKDGIVVNILGRAGVLQIDGEDMRPSLAEYLRARKVLSNWLTTSILLGSALLTIASRIKLVNLDKKDN